MGDRPACLRGTTLFPHFRICRSNRALVLLQNIPALHDWPVLWASHHPPFQETDMGRSITMYLFAANLCTAINVAKIHAITFGLIHIAKHMLQKVPINTFCHFELFV